MKYFLLLVIAVTVIVLGSLLYTKLADKPLITEGLRGPETHLLEQVYLAPVNYIEIDNYLPDAFLELKDEQFTFAKALPNIDEYLHSAFHELTAGAFEMTSGLIEPESLSELDIEYSYYLWQLTADETDSIAFFAMAYSPLAFEHWYYTRASLQTAHSKLDKLSELFSTQAGKSKTMGSIVSVSEGGEIEVSSEVDPTPLQEYRIFRRLAIGDTVSHTPVEGYTVSKDMIYIDEYDIYWYAKDGTYNIPLDITLLADTENNSFILIPDSDIIVAGDHFRIVK